MFYVIDAEGERRFLGNNPAPVRLPWLKYGSTPECPLIARTKWKPLIDELPGGNGPEWPFLSPTHDQNGKGQCNADATTSAMESQRLKQGLPLVMLSSGDLYHRINGGADRGSLLEDGLAESRNGVATIEDCNGNVWRNGRWQPGTDEQRAPFKVLEVYLCPTFDHCMSAVLMGFDLVSGIMWYANYKPERDGWLPVGRGSAGGHAVHGYKATYRGGQFGIWHKNSWGMNWGLQVEGIGGLCVFPESVYRGPVGGWWAIRSITDPGTDQLPLPGGGRLI